MSLDIRTLYIVMGGSCFLVAGAFLFFHARQFRTDGVREWSAGYAFQGIYWVFLGLRGLIPDFLSILVASTSLTTNYAMLYAAVREFQHRSYRRDLLFLPVIATIIFFFFFWAYIDSMFLRSVYICLVSAIQMGAIASLLFRQGPFQINHSQWLTGCFFATGAMLWLIRFLDVLIPHYDRSNLMGPSIVMTVLLLLGFGIVVLTSIGFLLMIRERAGEDLQKAQERLVQSEKLAALGKLAAGASHEILNPLNILSLRLEFLQMTDNLSEKAKEALKIAEVQIDRIVKITHSIREFSRDTALHVTTVNLRELMEDVFLHTSPRLKEENVTLDFQYQADIPSLSLDKFRIEQVILNLVNNAIDAMKDCEKKLLRVTASLESSEEKKNVRISFSDNGTGIKAEDVKRIFEPFFTTKEPNKGKGLGLSVCYGIIQDHKGRIWAENNELGGATFFIELPSEERAIF